MDYSNLKSAVYNKKHIKIRTNIFYITKKKNKSIEYKIHQIFIKKYISMPFNYNKFITNNIIFNDKSHLVSIFKEHLVIDDTGEFLKRYYSKNESKIRLTKFFEFYFLYSKVFPNYTSIYENKFLYDNIHQKQKMIDLQEKMEKERKNKVIEIELNYGNNKNFDVFSTEIINSLINMTNKEGIEMLFDVKKEKLTEEENNFKNGVNNIIEEIDVCKNKKYNYKNKNDIFIHLNSIYSKRNNNNKIIIKNIKSDNKENISKLSNDNNLSKLLKNSIKNKVINKDLIKELKNNIIKNKNNSLKNSLICKNSDKAKYNKILVEKMEKELFKMRKKFKNNKKYISQNISTSTHSKKDFSISKKNISLLNLNNSKSPSFSILYNMSNIPSSKVRSTIISSPNSFIKNKKFQKSYFLSGNNNEMSHKNLINMINNKENHSRNNQITNSSTTTNIFNNIIKYINKKYIDSRNKNININTISRINANSYSHKHKKILNTKIIYNNYNSNNILEHNHESKNSKEYAIKNRIKNILKNNKSMNKINLENSKTIIEKSLLVKNQKRHKIFNKNNKSNFNSTKNIFVNSYKDLNKKTIDNYNFCYDIRKIGRNNKNKLIINSSQTKINLTSRLKYNNKDNSFKKIISTKINNNKSKIHDIKKNSFVKISII